MDDSLAVPTRSRLISVEDYQPLVGAEAVERILKKAARLRDLHVVNVNSTSMAAASPKSCRLLPC